MELIGFSIAEDSIAIERGTEYFDLHNDFDFHGLTYSPSNQTLELLWRRGTGNRVKASEPAWLRLVFAGVHLFKAHQRDPAMPFSEDDCLEIIGFLWDDMVAEMGGDSSNRPMNGASHLLARFMSGFSIKVGAESVTLVVANSD